MDEAVDYIKVLGGLRRRRAPPGGGWGVGAGIPREVFPTPWDPNTTIFASSVEGIWCVVVL